MNRRQFLRSSSITTAGLLASPFASFPTSLKAQSGSFPDITITGIKIHSVRTLPPEPLGYGAAPTPDGITRLGGSIVEVSTDAGLTGWGEGRWGGDILRKNPELVVGRSPFEVEAIFDELTELEQVAYHKVPRNAPSQGGLDTALWDLVGQAAGKPISEVLGKRYRDRVMPYASAGYRKPSWNKDLLKGYADEYRRCVKDGFRAGKIKTGFGPTEDVAIVRAVREAVGDNFLIGIDSGTPGAYDDGTAVGLGRQLEEFNLHFWEEPINKWDVEGYHRLKETLRIPLASGEFLPVDWTIENYVNRKTVDIVQPDIIDTGLTGGQRIAHACTINRVRLVPHTWGGPIRNVASMHWVATLPSLSISRHQPPPLFELHLPEESAVWNLTEEPILVDQEDGMIPVPTGPGLGITINRDELERNRVDLIVI